jgi:hypothetical protein
MGLVGGAHFVSHFFQRLTIATVVQVRRHAAPSGRSRPPTADGPVADRKPRRLLRGDQGAAF